MVVEIGATDFARFGKSALENIFEIALENFDGICSQHCMKWAQTSLK